MRQNPELMKQFTQAAVNTMGQQQPGFGNFMNDVMGNRQEEPTIVQRGPPPPPISTKKERVLNTNPNMKNVSMDPMGMNNGLNINEQFSKTQSEPTLKSKNRNKNKRAEMKGPSDIDNILSRLKSKKVSMKTDKSMSSTISVEDLKEMSNVKMPKKSSKKRSSRNTISLDI